MALVRPRTPVRRSLPPGSEDGPKPQAVEKVNTAVRRHLATPGFKVAIVTRDATALRSTLTSGKPTPLTYDTQGTPDDVLAEDKVIEAYPLKDVTVKLVPVAEMFET